MRPHSLKGKLLLTISVLVIGSGLFIALLVTRQYRESLLEVATRQAEHLAHALALESADKVLTDDLVSLLNFLEYHLGIHQDVGYIFVVRNDQVLSHASSADFPFELIKANAPVLENHVHIQKVKSDQGEEFIDIAWPISSGKADVLRLGLSVKPYHQEVSRLGIQMILLTLGILILGMGVIFLFIRRVMHPLGTLAEAAGRVNEDNMEIPENIAGSDEVASLSASFSQMVSRLREYTQRLEHNAQELERAHRQTRTALSIVRDIGMQTTLKGVASYLILKIQQIVACSEIRLLIFSRDRETLFLFSDDAQQVLNRESFEPDLLRSAEVADITFLTTADLEASAISNVVPMPHRLAIFPIHHENEYLGSLLAPCPEHCHCIVKEIEVIDLILKQASGAIKRAAVHQEQILNLQSRIESTMEFAGIVGKDPQMQTVFKLIEDIAPTDSTVLIQGESGTGKELVAKAIHHHSMRGGKPFVVINCSAYPATLLESELFGHERGAFTGAIRQKIGRFEQADGGTIFLDEIGEIPPSAQIKLLRIIQTQKFERLGGERTIAVDVRIVSATNKDLLVEVKAGRFREDLYYRLNVIPIQLPPLRNRTNDIPILSRHFLRRFAADQDIDVEDLDFSSEAIRLLMEYPWPGNVRELENTVEHAIVLSKGSKSIEISDLPSELRKTALVAASSLKPKPEPSFKTIGQGEAKLLKEALDACQWNKKETARRLGISRSTLYEKIKKYQITPTLH